MRKKDKFSTLPYSIGNITILQFMIQYYVVINLFHVVLLLYFITFFSNVHITCIKNLLNLQERIIKRFFASVVHPRMSYHSPVPRSY